LASWAADVCSRAARYYQNRFDNNMYRAYRHSPILLSLGPPHLLSSYWLKGRHHAPGLFVSLLAQTQNVIGGISRNFEEVDRGPSYGVVCMHSTECRLLQCLIMYKHACKLTFRTSIPLTRRKICMLVPHSNFKRIFGIGK